MERTSYDDSQWKRGRKAQKCSMTLNLQSPNSASKKQMFTILTSPDILKLTTPEMEKYIVTTFTPTFTPTQVLFPFNVTEEQENLPIGTFNQLHQTVDACGNIINNDYSSNNTALSKISMPLYLTTAPTPPSVIKPPKCSNGILTTLDSTVRPLSVDSNNNSSCSSNSLPMPLELASVKEEFQTVPSNFSSPAVSSLSETPIDMADQERIKLEKKRSRNRIAADRCRKRKLEKISLLEEKVNDLKDENSKLEEFVYELRKQVYSLRQTLIEHAEKGCQITGTVHQTL